jgi:hypothetical protein
MMRLSLIGAVVVTGVVVWGAGIASASAKKPIPRPAAGHLATGNPKIGHKGTLVARARTTKAHRFSRVTPFTALRNYNIQTANATIGSGTQAGVAAHCATGTVVVGGGAFTSAVSLGANVNSSYPGSQTSWRAFESNATGSTDTLTSYVICATKPPYYAIERSAGVSNPAGSDTVVSVSCPATFQVLGVGARETSFDTAVNLNAITPFKATHPTIYGVNAWANNAGGGSDTAYAYAVCGKLKGWSMNQSANVDNPSRTETFVGEECPAGTVPTGGGVWVYADITAVNVNSTYPDPGFKGWGVYENNASGSDNSIYAIALCAL